MPPQPSPPRPLVAAALRDPKAAALFGLNGDGLASPTTGFIFMDPRRQKGVLDGSRPATDATMQGSRPATVTNVSWMVGAAAWAPSPMEVPEPRAMAKVEEHPFAPDLLGSDSQPLNAGIDGGGDHSDFGSLSNHLANIQHGRAQGNKTASPVVEAPTAIHFQVDDLDVLAAELKIGPSEANQDMSLPTLASHTPIRWKQPTAQAQQADILIGHGLDSLLADLQASFPSASQKKTHFVADGYASPSALGMEMEQKAPFAIAPGSLRPLPPAAMTPNPLDLLMASLAEATPTNQLSSQLSAAPRSIREDGRVGGPIAEASERGSGEAPPREVPRCAALQFCFGGLKLVPSTGFQCAL